MKVHDLRPAAGSTKKAKRVGRGTGGKGGKTAGRGTKGQRARNTVARGFEGGQMPLKQRVKSNQGHLSNGDAARFLATLVNSSLQQVVLAHLSETNNLPPGLRIRKNSASATL